MNQFFQRSANNEFPQDTLRFPPFNISALVPKNNFLSLESLSMEANYWLSSPSLCQSMDQRKVERELKVTKDGNKNLELRKSCPVKPNYACSMQNIYKTMPNCLFHVLLQVTYLNPFYAGCQNFMTLKRRAIYVTKA